MNASHPPGGPHEADWIATLAAERAVRRIHAAYSQACDDGRFEDLAALFADDVELVSNDMVIARGRAAARDWIAAAQPPERRGRHLVANAVIDVLAPDSARAEADFVFLAPKPEGLVAAATGRYRDRFVAPDGPFGRWHLIRREMVTSR